MCIGCPRPLPASQRLLSSSCLSLVLPLLRTILWHNRDTFSLKAFYPFVTSSMTIIRASTYVFPIQPQHNINSELHRQLYFGLLSHLVSFTTMRRPSAVTFHAFLPQYLPYFAISTIATSYGINHTLIIGTGLAGATFLSVSILPCTSGLL